MIIDIKYNMMSMVSYEDAWKMAYYAKGYAYTEEQTFRAVYHGSIYHFAGHDMWSYDGITPAHRIIFKKYRKLCDWRKEKMTFGGFKKFVNWCLVSAKRILVFEWPRTYRMMAKNYPED